MFKIMKNIENNTFLMLNLWNAGCVSLNILLMDVEKPFFRGIVGNPKLEKATPLTP